MAHTRCAELLTLITVSQHKCEPEPEHPCNHFCSLCSLDHEAVEVSVAHCKRPLLT